MLEEPRAQRRPREGRVPLRRARLRLVERHRAAVGQRKRDAYGWKQGWCCRPARTLCQWPRLAETEGRPGRWRGVLEGGLAEASGRLLSTERAAGEWKRLHWRHARREHVRARLPHDLLQRTRAESRRPDASAEGGERDRSAVSSHDSKNPSPSSAVLAKFLSSQRTDWETWQKNSGRVKAKFVVLN